MGNDERSRLKLVHYSRRNATSSSVFTVDEYGRHQLIEENIGSDVDELIYAELKPTIL